MSTSFRLAWLPVVLTAKLNGFPSRAHRGNVLTNSLQQLLDLAGSSWLFQREYWFRGTSPKSARLMKILVLFSTIECSGQFFQRGIVSQVLG